MLNAMKRKLLFLILILSTVVMFGQVSAGQVDDFEGTTDPAATENWIVGGASNVPENKAGGPGESARMLEYSSTGGNGPGSRMAFFNSNNQWSGDFISQGIVEIRLDVNATVTDLHVRIGFEGPNGSRLVSSVPVIVPVGSGWTSIALPISTDADLMVVQGPPGTTRADVLAGVSQFRILSAVVIDNFRGDVIASTMQVDNITASATLGRRDFDNRTTFSIYPNPSRSKLNITIPNFADNAKVEVYNILGARVYKSELNKLNTSIDVSKWNSGVYLVRVSSDKETLTKRFVKQ
jgi:hypothetical protein